MLDAVATADASGREWAVALVNRHPEKRVVCAVSLKDWVPEGDYPAMVLEGDSPDAYNSVDRPDRVVPRETTVRFAAGAAELPPHSLTIVRLKRP